MQILKKIEFSTELDQFGNLVTNQEQLKSLYVNTYKDMLRHRDMKPSISYLRDLKDFLLIRGLDC